MNVDAKILTSSFIYLFSFLGLAWVPPSLKKARWIFPLWFLIINLCLFSSLWQHNLNGKPWFFILCSQAGWILVSAFFISQAYRNQLTIHYPEWIQWQAYRLMSFHFLFLIGTYTLPAQFILEASVLECLIALSAIPLTYRIKKPGSFNQALLIGWNLVGFVSLWKTNISISTYYFKNPPSEASLEVVHYFNLFPEIWIPTFWIPVGIAAHVVMLSDLFRVKKK